MTGLTELQLLQLENIEDEQIIKKALADLKSANNDRIAAGWLEWDKIEQDLE